MAHHDPGVDRSAAGAAGAFFDSWLPTNGVAGSFLVRGGRSVEWLQIFSELFDVRCSCFQKKWTDWGTASCGLASAAVSSVVEWRCGSAAGVPG